MKLRFVLLVVCAVLAWAPAAFAAGGSAGDGYGGAANVQNEVNQGAAPAVASAGSLPFTGLDLALLVAGGATLLVLGVSLRRAAARRN
jgi:hypothetical protein